MRRVDPSARRAGPDGLEPLQNFGFALELNTRLEPATDRGPIELLALPRRYSANVCPVVQAICERLQYNQIFGGHGVQCNAWCVFEVRRTTDHRIFKREPGQRDIYRDSRWPTQKQHTILQGETACVVDTRFKFREQYLNVAIFATESDKQREVNVARKSRLAPANDGNAANETRSPLSHPNEVLQVCGLLNELVQRTNRPKSRCCSTSPE